MTLHLITLEQALFAHDKIVSETGGSQGIRDVGLLDSALNRPTHSFGGVYLYKTIFEKAAALIHSLIFNHPFVDGNKRISTFLTYRFLLINNYKLEVTNKDLVKFALGIESKKINLEGIAKWLKSHTKKSR